MSVHVLQPSRLRLHDSDEETSPPIRKKSGPKSATERKSVTGDLELTRNCTVLLNANEISQEMHRMTRSSKRKAEQIEEEVVSKENCVVKTEPKDDCSTEAKRPRDDGKNTDPTMTIKSKHCHICNKQFAYLSSHYAIEHEGVEVYSSRMSAKMSDLLRKCPPKECEIRKGSRISAFCYYCEKDFKADRTNWIAHFIRHTGEYIRFCKCTNVELTSKNAKLHSGHGNAIVSKVDFVDTLFVYMCRLCNYTQSQEENLKNHIRNMHDINVNVTSQYERLTIIPNLPKPRFTRTAQRATSQTSETDSVTNSEELTNQDVFKSSSNQDDDVNSDAFKLIKENSFNNSNSVPSTSSYSMADRLNKRFKNQKDTATAVAAPARAPTPTPAPMPIPTPTPTPMATPTPSTVKEEPLGFDISFREREEAARLAAIAAAAKTTTNSLQDNSVVGDNRKIELNKSQASTSAIQIIEDNDDWESCSSEDDEEEDENTQKTFSSFNLLIKKNPRSNKRIKPKKRGDKTILLALKKEKSDDVELKKDIKTEIKSPAKSGMPIRAVVGKQKRVDNMAYTECLGAKKFNCFIGNCDFLSVNNVNALGTHMRNNHSTERWSGYCHTCDKQILNAPRNSLGKEFDHLKDCHVPKEEEKTLKKTVATPKAQIVKEPIAVLPSIQLQANQQTQLMSKVAPQPPPPQVEKQPVMPMIRVRRFSGDNFRKAEESSPSTSTAIPSTMMAANAVPPFPNVNVVQYPNVTSMPINPVENTISDDQSADLDIENQMKPWTKCVNTKTGMAEHRLQREFSLVALFKCMAKDCIFTTSDKEKFLVHLQNHEDFLVEQASYSKHHSNEDDSSWLECCYCEEIPGSCSTLVDHIMQEHATSIFQCPYCFYRSVDRNNVSSHLNFYHKDREDKFIQVCGMETKSIEDEINELLAARQSIKLIPCPEIGKFLVINTVFF